MCWEEKERKAADLCSSVASARVGVRFDFAVAIVKR